VMKLWFASLLTIAVVFAQANNGSDNKSGGTAKSNTPNPKKGGKKSSGGSFEVPPSSFGVEPPRDLKNGGKKGSKKGGKTGPTANKQKPPKRPEAAPPQK
jgi:hypothetical protein